MHILVTGALGQLGRELRRHSQNEPDTWIFSDVKAEGETGILSLDICDVQDTEKVLKDNDIQVLVNCAGYTAVDKAEEDRETADRLNHIAVGSLASTCNKLGVTLIHISTDYIFGGETCTPLQESAPASPRSVYGTTKLAGENAIRESGCKYIILRTAWMYSPNGQNFLLTMLKLLSERKEIGVVYDQIGSPTFAEDLAKVIIRIISTRQLGKTGTYNYSCEGAVSWYDFAQAIRETGGFTCRIRPLLSSEYPAKARRPHYSVLDKSLIKRTFGIEVPYWRDSLEKCMTIILKEEPVTANAAKNH